MADGISDGYGDDLTAQEVVADYRRWAYRVAGDMLPGGTQDPDADDLAQEAYVAMWRALETHDPARGALPSWLTGAARLRMRDLAHGHGRWTGHEPMRGSRPVDVAASLDGMDGDDVDLLLSSSDLLEGVEWAYHRGEVARAVAALPDAERLYVVARFWYGLDPTSRVPGVEALVNEVPVLRQRGVWASARGRLRESLAHLVS